MAFGHLLSRTVLYGRIHDIDEDLVDEAVSQVLGILMKAKDATSKEAATVTVGLLSMSGLISKERIRRSAASVSEINKILVLGRKERERKGNNGTWKICNDFG